MLVPTAGGWRKGEEGRRGRRSEQGRRGRRSEQGRRGWRGEKERGFDGLYTCSIITKYELLTLHVSSKHDKKNEQRAVCQNALALVQG